MSEIRFINTGIDRIRGELFHLLNITVEFSNIEINSEELNKIVKNIGSCENQLSILRKMLLMRVLNEEPVESLSDGQN